jgi:sulfate/thiosulfate-binding protein
MKGISMRIRITAGLLALVALLSIAAFLTIKPRPVHADTTLLNVSYDPTRELYADYNQAFEKYWLAKTHTKVVINQSHGGSGKQARAVIDGLQADVVTLGIQSDIDAISKSGLIAPNWQSRLPHNSVPYTGTILFVVRKGNPKGIHDWADLIKPGVQVITPSPKTSSGGRWAFVAAYGYALKKYHSDAAARDYVTKLYANVPVLDSGARGSTTTFAQRGLGDVMIAWENEAWLTKEEFGAGNFDIVVPSISVLGEPPVAVVDKNAAAHNTTALATAYLQYLYSPAGQEIAARHYYRPINHAIFVKYQGQFAKVPMFTVEQLFGGWGKAQAEFFGDGGVFDQIYRR